ncbi:DeoR/GlpR family DNA-binding transcription regulator [Devosia sediminis]|uniref:DeoR/GlpR transcriptional regulator n=1 Tax=Devosia sediminis TaxID=2798801 RepID=A0A934IQP9_9HYPH|nr:DeoR/GlpR family DNA-binding transcription regulator [Devosia sediminis]MBJ3783441.1 DeoR/GlpR transcriptional regulator [Devosia sediminis]
MLTEERLDAIRQLLSEHGKVLANDLAAQFGVSDDTIRRDLRELARLGHCRRVYGGALLPAPDTGTLAVRTSDQADVKARLASATAALVRDGQTLYIDAGSTNLAIAKALPKDLRLTIVTNAPAIATAMSDNPKHTIVVLGGHYDQSKGACLGPQTIREAGNIFADMFILGACAIDTALGVTALDAAEAEVKRVMIAQSSLLTIAATSDKLGTIAPFKLAEVARIDHLVVEHDADLDAYRAFDIALHRAEN